MIFFFLLILPKIGKKKIFRESHANLSKIGLNWTFSKNIEYYVKIINSALYLRKNKNLKGSKCPVYEISQFEAIQKLICDAITIILSIIYI